MEAPNCRVEKFSSGKGEPYGCVEALEDANKKEKYDEDLDEDTDVNLVSKYGGVYKRSTR